MERRSRAHLGSWGWELWRWPPSGLQTHRPDLALNLKDQVIREVNCSYGEPSPFLQLKTADVNATLCRVTSTESPSPVPRMLTDPSEQPLSPDSLSAFSLNLRRLSAEQAVNVIQGPGCSLGSEDAGA